MWCFLDLLAYTLGAFHAAPGVAFSVGGHRQVCENLFLILLSLLFLSLVTLVGEELVRGNAIWTIETA